MHGLRDWHDRSGADEPLDQPGIAAGGDGGNAERDRDGARHELSVAGCVDREWRCRADDGGELHNDCGKYQWDKAGAAGGSAAAGAEFEWGPIEPGSAYGDERAAVAECAVDYDDAAAQRAGGNSVQGDTGCGRGDNALSVECCVGKPAVGIDAVERRSHFRNADGERNFDLQCFGDGLHIEASETGGHVFDCGYSCAEHTGGAEHQRDRAAFGTGEYIVCRSAERERRNAGLYLVAGFGTTAGRPGAFKRGRGFGNANGEWDLDLHGRGEGQRIAGTDAVGNRVDHSECSAEQADNYVNEPECGEQRKLL